MEPVLRPLVDDEHRLALVLLLTLLVSQFLLDNLDIVLLRQPPQCLGIGNLLVLHQETGRRTALAADETVTDILGGRHHKRRITVVVERTKALVVHATLTECHELTDHVDNLRRIDNPVYCRPVNHII